MNDIDKVLSRVADIAGVKSDSDIARIIGISPQAIGNARKRGSVPYEKLTKFAKEHDVSLDYLLGNSSRAKEIDLELFKHIQNVLKSEHSELREINAVDFSYYTAIIYNQVFNIADTDLRVQAILNSVIFVSVVALRKSQENFESPELLKLPGGKEFREKQSKVVEERIKELEMLIDNPNRVPILESKAESIIPEAVKTTLKNATETLEKD